MTDSSPCLRVYLLGAAFVEWHTQPLPIARRQARCLLYRLAAQFKPIPREELAFTFWPDEPEAAASRNLSHLVSHLRQSLPLPSVIRVTNDLVDLNPQLIWSDAAEFRTTCVAVDIADTGRLQQALELYRGPFMSGCQLASCPEFAAWVTSQRSQYQRLYLDALALLISMATDQAEYSKAIFYARHYLKVDELAEDIHRRLMMLHLLSGDRPAAMRQYHCCASVLKREFGIDPLPETRAVYQAILSNPTSL